VASVAAATYAQRVLSVFSTTMALSGESVAAELLCDLVLLLPDQGPRHLLRDALEQLCREEEAAGRPVVAKAKARPVERPAPAPAPEKPALLSRQLEAKLNAIPIGSSCRGDRLSFLSSLNAVFEIVESAGAGAAPVQQQALRRGIKQLDANQAESLQQMHQHLVSAGGTSLDFEPMDRLLSLRPLLQLKLGAGNANDDRARSWWEWKEAAAAAVHRLGQQERQAVKLYVSLCLQHLQSGTTSGAGYPAKAAPKQPPLAPAWDRLRPPPDAGDFPALPASRRQARA